MISVCVSYCPVLAASPIEVEAAAIARAPSTDARRWFDIAPQPLQSALERYGAITGRSLLYDSTLTTGRTSPAVQGEMTAEAALQLLLEGSGLVQRYTGVDTLVLVSVRQASADTDEADPTEQPSRRRYYGLIQSRVRDTFCSQPVLALGTHRIAVSLWIDATGIVGPVRLLDTTGEKALDALVVNVLQGVSVGEPVPAELAQPFTLVVMPRASGQSWGCPAKAGSGSVSPRAARWRHD